MKSGNSKRKSKPPRSSPSTAKKGAKKSSKRGSTVPGQGYCACCQQNLDDAKHALFVEEEVSRIFCSEKCIVKFFAPEIEKLESEYFRWLRPKDLTAEEREGLSGLRFHTLEKPNEVWVEKLLSGDHRYTLISEFKFKGEPVWCICLCLFLKGEPSFLYMAISTRDQNLLQHYRRNEKIQVSLPSETEKSEPTTDRLAAPFTEDELLRAQLNQERKRDDIKVEDYSNYEALLEQTLEVPDEVWAYQAEDHSTPKVYHFLRHFPKKDPGVWYIIIAKETDEEEQIEILDAFPTRDETLVDKYRHGEQEMGTKKTGPAPNRLIH